MLNFELYIEGIRVDLTQEQNIQLTDQLQDIRDIGTIFTAYSTQLSIPATVNTNTIFKHYYRFDIVGGFDARYKAEAVIKLNGVDWRKGKVQVLGVDLKNGVPSYYKIAFFGESVNLKDLVGDDELSSLPFLDNFNTNYNFIDVVNYISNGRNVTVGAETFNASIIAPLISAHDYWYYDTTDTTSVGTGNLYPSGALLRGADYTNFKYAIRCYCILKAIEDRYTIANGFANNIVFSTDFFTTSNTDFHNMYMWLHREKGKLIYTGNYNENINKMNITTVSPSLNANGSAISVFDSSTYTATFNMNVSLSAPVFDVYLEKGGVVVAQYLGNFGSTSYVFPFTLNGFGYYRIRISYTSTNTILSTSTIGITGAGTGTITFGSNQTLSTGYSFQITSQIPKLKVLDFLDSMFKMFNLTAYYEDDVIVVDTLDNYYSAGTETDITEYINTANVSIDTTAIYKTIEFKFEGNESYLVKNHKELFNKDWATAIYNEEAKTVGKEYTISIPFEKFKYERIYNGVTSTPTTVQWGWSVDAVDENGVPSDYMAKPLVFYAIRKTSGWNTRIHSDATYSDITTYYVPSNSVDLTDSQTMNFKAEVNEYAGTVFTDTLFSTYYSSYISSLFNINRKMATFKAKLPLKILLNYGLNDVFIINGVRFRINSIKSNLKNGDSVLELYNI